MLTTRPLFPFPWMLLQNVRLRGGLGQLRLNDKLRALLTARLLQRRFPPSSWSHWLPILTDVNAKLLRCAVSINTVQTHPVPE